MIVTHVYACCVFREKEGVSTTSNRQWVLVGNRKVQAREIPSGWQYHVCWSIAIPFCLVNSISVGLFETCSFLVHAGQPGMIPPYHTPGPVSPESLLRKRKHQVKPLHWPPPVKIYDIIIYIYDYIYTCMYAHERIIADKASLLWSVTLHATDMQTWTAAPWGLSRSLGTIVQVSRERKYSSTDIKMVCSLRFYCIDLFYLHISTCFICVFDIIGCTDVEFYSILLYCVLFCSVLFFFIGLFWAVQLPKSCAQRR